MNAAPAIARVSLGCPGCGKNLIHGGVLTTRVVRLGLEKSEARCNRCRRWVLIPVVIVLPRTPSR